MKNKIFLFVVLYISCVVFSGCSAGKVFLPYEEEPLCNAGKESGYCGSVSDVYETIIKEELERQ